MEYNLGADGVITGYPKMSAAIRRQDWAEAAKESERNKDDPGFERRNRYVHNLFMEAAMQTGR